MRGLIAFNAAYFFCASLAAQTVTSSIVGTVTDPANAVIPAAAIVLTDQSTGNTRQTATDGAGLFRFPNLPAGAYSISVKAPGFKAHLQRDINLASSETRDTGALKLEVGSVTEQIAVVAETTPVQLASSEKGALIDNKQLNQVALKGRDLFGYMSLIPGVIDTANRDVTSPNGFGNITINGNTSAKNYTVDGVTNVDTGSNGTILFQPNMDSVQEVRVLTSNYAAEFGRNSGGTISVVTKSGGRDFHGSGWWTHRHEQFNANNFFNNRSGLPRTPYRYNVAGWSLGGPVYIPGKLNTGRSKFFFFASQEYTKQLQSYATQYRTVPTEIERNGDFSRSLDGRGALIRVIDPNTGAQFPNNVIPRTRIDTIGQKMLQFFPTPNFAPGPGHVQFNQVNFQNPAAGAHPRRNDVIRGDVRLNDKLSGYFRYINDFDQEITPFQGIQWNSCCLVDHPNPGHGYATTLTYSITPTTINEVTFGKTFNTWSWYTMDEKAIDRSVMGSPPTLFKHAYKPASESNAPHSFIPTATFGGAPPNTASFGTGNAEYYNANNIWSVQDNLSKVIGSHSLKTGFYWEYNSKLQPGGANYRGVYNFGHDANNPLSTGNGFANAILGNFTQYQETSRRTVFDVRYQNFEFYGQDNWRVNRRLTVDFGVRFYHQTPQVDKNKTFALFDATTFNKNNAPRLYYPGADAGGRRVAMDLVTRATAPVAAIGLFVPGTGNPTNGMLVPGENGVPAEPYSQSWLATAPRVGFAYDVFGNGKTALRGGFGVFFNRLDGNRVYNMSALPPVAFTPNVYYSTINSLANGGGLIGPSNVGFFGGRVPWDRVQNGSLGIQHSLGHDMVLDVAYVGNWGRNQILDVNINPIPLGSNFNPANADPTRPTSPLSANFLRVNYPGYGDITSRSFLGYTNYNSLQTTLNRRFTKGLMFGVAHTWSHSLGVTAFDPLVADNNTRNYGPTAADRRHVLAVNYVYELPRLGKKWNKKALGFVTDHWTLSGVSTFITGAPIMPGFSSAAGVDIAGSPNAQIRLAVVGDPKSATSDGTRFNTAAFAQPARGTLGNLGLNALTGPGTNNWDATLAKNIPLGNERRVLRFRVEAYNVFNHTQYSAYNTATAFNAAGVNTNTEFGRPSAARPARIIAFATRVEF